ncbi:MAG: hypothetical protein NTZ97_03385 [Candidatus Moranbacteria bacterium]|nr:hypothetical protein [Candidatus Moranbacteria bacterium]
MKKKVKYFDEIPGGATYRYIGERSQYVKLKKPITSKDNDRTYTAVGIKDGVLYIPSPAVRVVILKR